MSRMWKPIAALFLLALPVHAQEFGSQVAVVGDEILVAEPLIRRGAAMIHRYRRSGGEWEEVGTISAPTPGGEADYFARFLAVDDETLVAGATFFENSTGAVWTFDRDGDDWEPGPMLRGEGVVEEEAFGRFGRLYDDLLFVSSLGFAGSGAVWVFERGNAGDWTESAVIVPENPAPEEFFGWDLDYDGERLIVGSFAGETGTGAAYVFARDASGAWVQEVRLALDESESMTGDVGQPGAPGAGAIGVGWFEGMALLGLPGRNIGEGAVYTYRPLRSGRGWVRGVTLSAFDREPVSFFGHEFHTHEGELWVSAPGAGIGGSIYRFTYDADTGTFEAASRIRNEIDPDLGDGFGGSIDTEGDLAVVGQPGDDGGLGSVIVLRNDDGEWAFEAKLLVPGDPGLPMIADDPIECGEDGTAAGYPCSNVDILSFLSTEAIGGGRQVSTNDVWGWTDPDSGDEYAIVGRTDGISFIDISDPNEPQYLGDLPKTPGTATAAWRDMKVFDDHVFVVADGAGPHGMQVFDLTRLRDVDDEPVRFEPDFVYDRIASAHNIVLNEATGIAYAVGANGGGDTCGGGLHMIDVNDPTNPEFLGCFQDLGTGRSGTGYAHDAMCVVYDGPDTEHVARQICFGANETHLSIADVTDPESPVGLGNATYPGAAYAHQGWITEDHRYFYLGDELDEGEVDGDTPARTRTLIWDVTDLDDPVLLREHFGEVVATDHNLYIRGDLMYQSNYTSGLRILNISDPENPVEVGYLDTVPSDESVRMNGSWSNYPYFESGTIVVSSRGEGVFFVRYSPRELLP